MIDLLIWILIFAVVLSIVIYIIRLLPLPPPFGNVAIAVVALIALLVLLEQIVPLSGMHGPLIR